MDESRFDAFTRAVAAPISRRGALRTLLGAAVAGLAAGPGRGAAQAQDLDPDAARKGPFWRAGKRCATNDRCGSRAPCTDGRCVPDSCLVGDDDPVPANTTNPDNPCEYCLPSAASWTGWAGTKGDGAACEAAGDAASPCRVDAGQCLAGVCVRDPLPNGELCGAGRVCCGGDCCTATQCCGGAGVCEECGPHCTIGDDTPPAGTPNPDGSCTACNPDADPFYWSTAPDDMPCGPNRDQFCCAGSCRPEPCEPHCVIGETRYEADEVDTENRCQLCKPDQSTSAWTTAPDDFPCGTNPHQNQLCCSGVCCGVVQCCGADGQCSSQCDPVCTIGDDEYPDGEPNPDNDCEYCNLVADPFAWSDRPFPTSCGGDPNRLCCHGVCCGPGETCDPVTLTCAGDCAILDANREDGSCDPDAEGCTIGGTLYENGAKNPANECQRCNVWTSTSSWSSGGFGACGPNQDRFCSGGVCCDLGICPDLAAGACGDYCDDVCVIGGVEYRGGDRNPANPCEACGPQQTHTAWYPLGEGFACDPVTLTGGFCCGGTCCPPGSWCSDEGACVASGS